MDRNFNPYKMRLLWNSACHKHLYGIMISMKGSVLDWWTKTIFHNGIHRTSKM